MIAQSFGVNHEKKNIETEDKMSSLRILLVDENNEFKNSALRFINSRIRFESLSWASNGQEALEKIETIQPTLILIDSSIVEKNGRETIKIIRKLDKNAIIIFLTFENEFNDDKKFLTDQNNYISRTEFTENIIPMVKKLFGDNVSRMYS